MSGECLNKLKMCVGFVKQIAINEVGIVEFGIGGVRLDAILINTYREHIRGFEFKVTRADFLKDNKWQQYLKYCNSFYFVCPKGIIRKEEVPKNIGLVYVECLKEKSYIGDEIIQTEHIKAEYIKRATGKPMDREIYIRIISLLLNRAQYRLDAFF